MSTIIAGRFKVQPQVQNAIDVLRSAGFAEEHISAFYVNPPGQHNLYALGGDEDKSPGAENTPVGAIGGIAAGAAIGLAAIPIIGPVGPVVGAYVGSLMGSMASTKENHEMPHPGDGPCEHPSGMLVAVALEAPDRKDEAIELLRSAGGFDLEIAHGEIQDGDWVDFDPRERPEMIDKAH